MRYVILRDDDTNAFTPVDRLERLYRPFLQRGLPVNLATIPNVRIDAVDTRGQREGFLPVADETVGPYCSRKIELKLPRRELIAPLHHPRIHSIEKSVETSGHFPNFSTNGSSSNDPRSTRAVPIAENNALVRYLKANSGYHIVQHGFHHSCCEFGSQNAAEIRRWLDDGTRLLMDAGFPKPDTFVAPHDRLSRTSFREAARRFRVISTGWFEARRIPVNWWPAYGLKKLLGTPHWSVGKTRLLSHPGCLLSHHKPYDSMLESIRRSVASHQLTVLVTHWWEYFREGEADRVFIDVLHQVAAWLSTQREIQVVSFRDLAEGRVPID